MIYTAAGQYHCNVSTCTALTQCVITSNNQRLGGAFDDLDPRLSLLSDVIRPCQKNLQGMLDTCPKIHPVIPAINVVSYNLDSNLGVRSSYVEHNQYLVLLYIYIYTAAFLRRPVRLPSFI